MADILAFPTECADPAAGGVTGIDDERFLLDEGLELLADFRAIADRDMRDTLRGLVKTMATASRRATGTRR